MSGAGATASGGDGSGGAPGGVVGPVPAGRDPGPYDRLRRRVLWSLPTGLYVLGTRDGPGRNLMTVSWVTQVAVAPKLVAVSVEAGARSHALLVGGRVFALSVLARGDRALVRHFAKPVGEDEIAVDAVSGVGTMRGQPVRAGTTGAPVLAVAVAWLDCEVRHTVALGSHTLFVGEVVDCDERTAPAGEERADATGVLRMEDTRMNYGG